jgi:tetratricopeptide (TPR) repeat protein
VVFKVFGVQHLIRWIALLALFLLPLAAYPQSNSIPLMEMGLPEKPTPTIDDPAAYFEKAQEQLNAENLDGALTRYRDLIDANHGTASTWFNLGVIYAQQGEIGEAIHAFKNALILRPDWHEATENLNALRNLVPEAYQTHEVPLTIQILFFFYYLLPFPAVLMLLGVFILIGSGAWWYYSYTLHRNPRFLWVTIIGFSLALLTLGDMLVMYISYVSEEAAVHGVIIEDAPFRLLPSEQIKENEVLPEGTEVYIYETSQERWKKVMLPDNRDGYVREEHVNEQVTSP